MASYSPRIRGDGPCLVRECIGFTIFSPYSPGMVRSSARSFHIFVDSPRIRGDGPLEEVVEHTIIAFSPYSRGWSRILIIHHNRFRILPVFAGMVPQTRGGNI